MPEKYLPHQILTYQDIMHLMVVSDSTAKKYLKDIKTEYALKVVCFSHYQEYFKL